VAGYGGSAVGSPVFFFFFFLLIEGVELSDR